ncbi:3-phosphoserine/phosphohydroxythreonine transaminase [Nosocomiicoccus sp. HMSC059G07]|uniref:3-phosphoserine/phosphohydroxythreonine transaminase n=1 Tax=Nosocomiicoccus sp. HMSC059G07 TaxID=1739531 RepID=UPI0008A308ED|nr:3-phosphoserine/phosphohydroxythreonine transaminase [Nosocomiicoccus sp. HMSC059G07]OFO54080.1 3-phosphoserine/phosphohydroxythreonine aminotransferase [Nosocomiicoccus sp. HMSC059G07]
MKRTFNLSAGPAMLPTSVLERAQKEMLDYDGTGMSVMEMSHRSSYFDDIIQDAEKNLRELLNINDNYKILFLQGGASQAFYTLVMNLKQSGKVAYIDSGNFAKKALEAAEELKDDYGLEIDVVASSKEDGYKSLPNYPDTLEGYDYLHICSNNTIEGTQFKEFPIYKGIPLVCDMSSDILSRPFNINDFGMIYAGAQKNLGIAGLALVIIREDLLGLNDIPKMFDYKVFNDKNSMYNTPSTYPIYIHKLVTDWLLEIGGLEEIYKRNKEKARILYDYLDESTLFVPTANKDARSLMNVTFSTGNDELDKEFVAYTKENGFENIKGHRSVGGMRASIYNAFPIEGVEALVQLMKKFEEEN